MKKIIPFLQQTELFSDLNPDEILDCLHTMETYQKSYQKGDFIITHLSKVHHVGLILKGEARASMPNYDGREYHLHHYHEGMLFAEAYALQPQSRIPMDITAATACQVLFLSLLQIPSDKLMYRLLKITSKSCIDQNLKIRILSQKHIRARLISYIRVKGLADEQGVVNLPFNRENLANYLGVERSALSRELSRMRDEGLLEYHQKRLVFKKLSLVHTKA